jgi:CRISPR/Cas system-associated endonuclease Cas3-HD
MASKLKIGPLLDNEKIYIAERFLKHTIEEIAEDLKRSKVVVKNYILKLKHKTKEEDEQERIKKEQEEKLVEKSKEKKIVLDRNKSAMQMTQEFSSLPLKSKKYQSPFKT